MGFTIPIPGSREEAGGQRLGKPLQTSSPSFSLPARPNPPIRQMGWRTSHRCPSRYRPRGHGCEGDGRRLRVGSRPVQSQCRVVGAGWGGVAWGLVGQRLSKSVKVCQPVSSSCGSSSNGADICASPGLLYFNVSCCVPSLTDAPSRILRLHIAPGDSTLLSRERMAETWSVYECHARTLP
jgi:hypothetical protein